MVETKSGPVRGSEKGGVLRFRGIPYAAPPVGSRRFRPPEPVEPWTEVRDATAFGAMAPQVAGGLEAMLGSGAMPQAEDCLFLNVVTPACDDGARPVMVWIHGGGFTSGAGSVPWYHGTRFAALDDVVVVAINYRLGVLGFSHLPDLGEGYAGSVNCGILDQVAALRWVADNIASFGGDPGLVTVFGESAGGMSTSTLLGTPAAAGLIQRAIAQSGSCQAVSSSEQAAATTAAVLDAIDASSQEALLDARVEALLAAQEDVAAKRLLGATPTTAQGLLPFQPAVDGVVLPEPPLEAIAAGTAAGVEVMTGWTAEEFNLFTALVNRGPLDESGVLRFVSRTAGAEAAPAIIDEYRAGAPEATPDELLCAIATDRLFRRPAEALLDAQSAHADAYGYQFSYRSTAFDGKLGACHALDVPFTFDVVDRPASAFFVGEPTEGTIALARSMRSAWAAFARAGAPAAEGLPAWPRWDPEAREVMDLDVESSVRSLRRPG
jgi:para-nitrobenzyl esterase